MHEVTQAGANNEDGVHGVVHVSECGPGFIFPAHTWNVQGAFVRGVLDAVLLAWPCYPAWDLADAVASPATCGRLPPAGGVHGAYLGRVPPRLLSAREEGYLV